MCGMNECGAGGWLAEWASGWEWYARMALMVLGTSVGTATVSAGVSYYEALSEDSDVSV